MKNRALIISGGGAKGSFGCGVAEKLVRKDGNNYDLIIGTSTGALQMSHIGLNRFETLKEAYLNVNQKSIFDFNPFKSNGDINLIKTLIRLILNKDSLGDSNNLKKLITQFFTHNDYNQLLNNNIDVHAVLVNMTDKKSYNKSIRENSYEDMVDWIWGSCNVPIFMSYLNKDGSKWIDGGVKEHTPIQYAIDNGYSEIDVIVHRTKNYTELNKWEGKGIIKNLLRIIQILTEDVSENDILVSKLKAVDKNVDLHIYYTPYDLTSNSLIFNKEQMMEWWNLGYNTNCECKKITI